MLAIDLAPDGRVVMSGRLDASQAAGAQAFLDKQAGQVTLDCTALDYLSSAGLGVLLKTQKRLTTAGGRMRLIGVSKHLHDIFVYSGFGQIFDIELAP